MKIRDAALAVALTATAPVSSSAQIINGRVFEAGSDRPIVGALVTVMASGRSELRTESDSLGFFQAPMPRPGAYAIRVERLGYATTDTDTLSVRADETVEIAIRLGVTPVRLEPVMVIERRSSMRRSEFQRRMDAGRQSGLGVFMTRDEIERTGSPSVTGVLLRAPLVSLGRGGGPVMLSRGGCTPTLYLNGSRMVFASGESLDDRIIPEMLEGVEIYRNETELPFEFTGIGQCGAILFWTRAGEPGRRGAWRILVGGAAFFGMMILFVTN
ncbi:MAG: carboxypeptidase regulatory-like domain-containing protein [Longimicrobiales bacterium]